MLPQQLDLPKMQTTWAQQLNPVIANALVQGQQLNNIQLINGVTVVNHKLGRKMQGWIVVDMDAASIIYRSQPFNALTLTLTSNAAVSISLWVF